MTCQIAPLNFVRDAGLKSSNFITWTGIRQSVPLKLRCNMPNLKVIIDLKNFKSCDYYPYLIKKKYEVSEAFVMPLRVANEPYLHSFQYKVSN